MIAVGWKWRQFTLHRMSNRSDLHNSSDQGAGAVSIGFLSINLWLSSKCGEIQD